MLDLLGLIGGLVGLLLGAELLVRGASALARSMGVSSFFIGLTVVGFGTSTPELVSGLMATLRGQGDVNLGNVMGSNIFNLGCILGLVALIAPVPCRTRTVRREVWVVIGAAVLVLAFCATGGQVGRVEGGVLVLALGVYLWRGLAEGQAEPAAEALAVEEALREETSIGRGGGGRSWACIVGGLVLLVVGSRLMVDGAVGLASGAGVSPLVIGLTLVAAGTSMPELVTSVVAAIRRQSDISIGNLLGSNVFNSLGVLGVTAVVRPQEVPQQVLFWDGPFMLVLSLACLPIVVSGGRVGRWEGGGLLSVYVVYLIGLMVLTGGSDP